MIAVTWRYEDIPEGVEWKDSDSHRFIDDDGDPGWSIDGIEIHMLCCSPLAHQDTIMHSPVWRLGKKRILYDPSGILRWGEECVERFARDNPGICAQVDEFVRTYQRWKRDKRVTRYFERLEDFMATVDLSHAVFNFESFAHQQLKATR